MTGSDRLTKTDDEWRVLWAIQLGTITYRDKGWSQDLGTRDVTTVVTSLLQRLWIRRSPEDDRWVLTAKGREFL